MLEATGMVAEIGGNSHGTRIVPIHLQPLYDLAQGSCHGPEGSRKVAELATQYSKVFSTGRAT